MPLALFYLQVSYYLKKISIFHFKLSNQEYLYFKLCDLAAQRKTKEVFEQIRLVLCQLQRFRFNENVFYSIY